MQRDIVIDPCFGSGSTGRACLELNRNFYGFEINKEFYRRVKEEMCVLPEPREARETICKVVAAKKFEEQMTLFDLISEE